MTELNVPTGGPKVAEGKDLVEALMALLGVTGAVHAISVTARCGDVPRVSVEFYPAPTGALADARKTYRADRQRRLAAEGGPSGPPPDGPSGEAARLEALRDILAILGRVSGGAG
jgi:hypothetical protein